MRTSRASSILLIAGSVVLTAVFVSAHLTTPPPATTGAPGQGTCADAGCHDSYPLNSGPGRIDIWELSLIPPDTLVVQVNIRNAPGVKFGFEGVAFSPGGDTAYQLVLVDSIRTQLLVLPDSSFYISHTSTGSLPLPSDTLVSWQYRVILPEESFSDGPCRILFISAVAADGDSTASGDYVYTATSAVAHSLCLCWLNLAGDVNESGSLTSGDIIALVGYVFKSGPEPVPCAVIGDVNCSGTVSSADIIYLVSHLFRGARPPCDVCNFSPLLWEC